MGDMQDQEGEEQHFDGENSGVASFDWALTADEVETVYETWEELVADHDTVDAPGLVFPSSCLRCDEGLPQWEHEIRKHESGRIIAELKCTHCGAEYKQERVV
jgi:hypothetical protein